MVEPASRTSNRCGFASMIASRSGRFGSSTMSARPGTCFLPIARYRATAGRRRSASISRTRASEPWVSAAARLIAVTDFPSLTPGLVMANMRTPRECWRLSSFNRNAWYCSASRDVGDVRLTRRLSSFLEDVKTLESLRAAHQHPHDLFVAPCGVHRQRREDHDDHQNRNRRQDRAQHTMRIAGRDSRNAGKNRDFREVPQIIHVVERLIELLGGQHGADAGGDREYQAEDDESRAIRGDRRGRRKRVLENPELFTVPVGFEVLAELCFVEFLE